MHAIILNSTKPIVTAMDRLISLDIGERGGFGGSHIVYMLCMIVVSMFIFSMIIFTCGDSNDQNKWHGGGGGGGGGCGGGWGAIWLL